MNPYLAGIAVGAGVTITLVALGKLAIDPCRALTMPQIMRAYIAKMDEDDFMDSCPLIHWEALDKTTAAFRRMLTDMPDL